MSADLEPDDPQLSRLLAEYADSFMSDRANAAHAHPASRRSILRRLRASALVAAFVFGSVTVAAAATAGGIIGFGTPRQDPGQPPAPTPAQPIGRPQVTGELERGWVFAVDGADVAENAEVVLIDPVAGQVVSRYPTGYDPEIAISPKGDVLYVASSFDGESTLRAIDPRSGSELFAVPFPHRMMRTLPAVRSNLVVSGDGRWIVGSTLRVLAPGKDHTAVAALDTQSRTWTDELTVPGCLSPLLLARESGATVICGHDGRVLDLSVVDGKVKAERERAFGSTIAGAARVRDGLFAVSDDGVLRVAGATSLRGAEIGRLRDSPAVWPGGVDAAKDGTRVVIGVRGGSDTQGAVALTVVSDDGGETGAWELETPIWSIAGAGDRIYATSGGTLILFDEDMTSLGRTDAGAFLSQPLVVP